MSRSTFAQKRPGPSGRRPAKQGKHRKQATSSPKLSGRDGRRAAESPSTELSESSDLAQFIRDSYAAASRGDAEWFEKHLASHDSTIVIGTDPDEWWTGPDSVAKAVRGQLEATGGFEFAEKDLRCYAAGGLGWAVDRPTIRIEGGEMMPTRLTTVATRESGAWQLLHMHLSFGVKNEEAFDQELPV